VSTIDRTDRLDPKVPVEEAAVFLDPSPHALEMGVQRLDSGQLLVAARTHMPGCSGRMFEWWFRFAPDTRQYAWWHPLDHVSSRWVETSPRTHVGSTHLVEERLGAEEVYELQIHFIDPAELFGAEAVQEALDAGHVSAIVAAQLARGPSPSATSAGDRTWVAWRTSRATRPTAWCFAAGSGWAPARGCRRSSSSRSSRARPGWA
jgi:hypothetical protein